MNRALQRTGGNIVGACLVGLILATAPSIWTIILLVAFLSFATEMILGANYGLALSVVFSSLDDRAYLAEHHERRLK